MLRRVVIGIVIAAASWLAVLVVLGFALASSTGAGLAKRLGASLGATATVGDTSLGLVRGALEIEQLAVRRRDTIGEVSLDVARLSCDLPPLGLALIDRSCGELAIAGVRLELSTAALFTATRQREVPLRVDRVVIEDAVFVLMPSALVPGLGRIEIRVARAVSGATVFRSPLSWLFTLRELRASVDVAGAAIEVRYANGVVGASGSVFGSAPIELPFVIPLADPPADAKAEIARLIALGKQLAQDLLARRASDWLKSKLP